MTELRIVQFFIPSDTGPGHLTRYTIQQNINGQWTELPVTFQEEDDPSILARFKKAENAIVEVSDGEG
jgi:hypothetical protein